MQAPRLQGYLVARRTSVWQNRATDPSGNDSTFALKLPLSASCRGGSEMRRRIRQGRQDDLAQAIALVAH
jgi:hypothetical protein